VGGSVVISDEKSASGRISPTPVCPPRSSMPNWIVGDSVVFVNRAILVMPRDARIGGNEDVVV